jgi:hypothetical protein
MKSSEPVLWASISIYRPLRIRKKFKWMRQQSKHPPTFSDKFLMRSPRGLCVCHVVPRLHHGRWLLEPTRRVGLQALGGWRDAEDGQEKNGTQNRAAPRTYRMEGGLSGDDGESRSLNCFGCRRSWKVPRRLAAYQEGPQRCRRRKTPFFATKQQTIVDADTSCFREVDVSQAFTERVDRYPIHPGSVPPCEPQSNK